MAASLETQAYHVVIPRHGDPSVLEYEPWSCPAPGTGQVQVAVEQIGVNFADVMMRMGLYPEAPKPPFVPGYEIAGRVAQVGAGASGFKPGDRVLAATRFGGYTSHTNLPAGQLAKIPRTLSMQDAAATPVNYLTAWAALLLMGRVRKKDRVLIHGGAGGVGLAAVAIAKRMKCEVYATAGSARKVAFLEDEAGVEQAFDYLARPFADQVRAEVGEVDLVLDPVGGNNLRESLRVLLPGGLVVSYGLQEAVTGRRRNPFKALGSLSRMRFSALDLMHGNRGVAGLNLLRLWEQAPERLEEGARWCVSRMARGRLPKPRVDRTFRLQDAHLAHEYLQSRRNIGKVLLAL